MSHYARFLTINYGIGCGRYLVISGITHSIAAGMQKHTYEHNISVF